MSIKVKICGIRTLDAALIAVENGADFLGFNFISTSKRFIDPILALEIINKVRGKVKIVGVFQNADIKYVIDLAANLNLDFVQLHGNEDNNYIDRLDFPVIKTINADYQIGSLKAKYFLLDRDIQGKGKFVNPKKAAKLAINFPLFYAGGLNPENVAEAIVMVKPFAIDVAGGIETNGKQDVNKIKLFINNSKGAI